MAKNTPIRGNQKLATDQLVTWYDEDTGLDHAFVLKPLTKSVKYAVIDLQHELIALVAATPVDEDGDPKFSREDDEAQVKNLLAQIDALTDVHPDAGDDQRTLGELIRDQRDADKVIDGDILNLVGRLKEAAGKPSAS